MTKPDDLITVCSVNWFSCDFLEMLFDNLIQKAQTPDKLRFLIVDNTNGRDTDIEKIAAKFQNITIIKNDSGTLKGSPAHCSGLNVIMKNIETPYALIIDPDVYVFKKNWDAFLIDLTALSDVFAAGVSYPAWKLGTYHNFPNPIFCFFKTNRYREFSPAWSAYDVSKIILYWDFIRRNLLRLGIFINRKRFEDSKLIRTLWPHLEKIIGICSRDTGWRIAQKAEKTGTKTILFQPQTISSENFEPDIPRSAIAKYFELYCYQNEPIFTHKYSTNSTVFKTDKSGNYELWVQCIKQIEKR